MQCLFPLILTLVAATYAQDCKQDIQCLLNAMTLDEKLQFFAGDLDAIDHIKGVSRLGVPDINMGDGPNGVANTIKGTATSFPCNLAVGMSFDRDVARKYAGAMAKEFKAKGKNTLLGPGANLARVPECGRMDEYVPGDDPVLGAAIIEAFVKGALDEHVMTVVKHLVNNDQELNRNDWNANPDTNVLMEYYMKPFFGGIEAGAAALMCSYNKVLGVPACRSEGMLKAAKSAGSNFYIVSDWGAVYPEAAQNAAHYINAGMDVEMGTHDDPTCGGNITEHPDCQATPYGGAGYCNAGDYMLPPRMKTMLKSGAVSMARVNETVVRVLGALKTAGLLDKTVQAEFPAYTQKDLHSKWYGPLTQKDVRTAFSRQVGQEVARNSMVLLQNRGALLPLAKTEKLETYGCGDEVHFHAESGSASGTEPNIPAVVDRCKPDGGTACPYPEDALKVAGMAMTSFRLQDGDAGPRDPEATAIVCLVAAAKNTEGTDRANLDLLGADKFPFAKYNKSVVWVIAPGPVLMPFAATAGAIVLSSLPGEMGGAALADLLLGVASPSAHLSLSMPNKPQETQVKANPKSDDYPEGFEVGYRWYQARNVKPNFAFGWGLSYAKYVQVVSASLSAPCSDAWVSVRLQLRADIGDTSAAVGEVSQVAQLYLQHRQPQSRKFLELAGFGKARGLQNGQLVALNVEFDAPRTWGSNVGDKAGFNSSWEAVTEYKIFLSLYGVEQVQELFLVKSEGGRCKAMPLHSFSADGPLNFDQDEAVYERENARGIASAKPKPHVWGQQPQDAVIVDTAAAVVSESQAKYEWKAGAFQPNKLSRRPAAWQATTFTLALAAGLFALVAALPRARRDSRHSYTTTAEDV